MAASSVRRAVVRIGERQVHFRYAGSGAPVVLLHQSPRSSAELVPLLQFLSKQFLAIAPDAPGFGLSDPIKPSDNAPNIDEFCDGLLAFLDALDLPQVALFGSHTGAIIAVRFASRYARRVSAVVANGILLTTAEERADTVERYLPRFVPAWDGSHLAWLWSRLRDQLVFYPWYHRDPANRIFWPQTLQEIEDGALDLLQAGDNYRGAYGAVLDYAIAEDLPHLTVPTLLLVAGTDALSRFVEHYPPLPAGVQVSIVADFPDIPAATLDFIRRYPAEAVVMQLAATPAAVGLSASFIDLGDGCIHLRSHCSPKARPVLVLHDLGSSAQALNGLLGGVHGNFSLFVPDLPGHGESDGFTAMSPDELAAVLLRLMDALGLARFDVIAIGAAAAIALSLRHTAPQRLRVVQLVEPPLAREAVQDAAQPCVPDFNADISGSHLPRAWYFLRDRELFAPWHDRSAAAQRSLQRPPRASELQQSLIDLLKSRSVFPAQLQAALAVLTPTTLRQNTWTLFATDACAALHGSELKFCRLPDEKFQWTATLLRAMAHSA